MFLKTVSIYSLVSILIVVVTTEETINLTPLISRWNQLRSDNNQGIEYHPSHSQNLLTINDQPNQLNGYENNQITHYQDHEALIKAFLDLLLAYRLNGLPNLQDQVVIEGAAAGFRNFLRQVTSYVDSNPDLMKLGSLSSNTTVLGEARRLFGDWIKLRGQSMSEWWTTMTKYSTTTTTTGATTNVKLVIV